MLHDLPDEPVWLYSELDDELREVRKVELFSNGDVGFASDAACRGNTLLSIEPLPSLEQIAADPQFKPVEISQTEFDKIWSQYVIREQEESSGRDR